MKTRDDFQKLHRQTIIISSLLCVFLLAFTGMMLIFSNQLINLDKSTNNNYEHIVVNTENADGTINSINVDVQGAVQNLELLAIFIVGLSVIIIVWLSISFNKWYELKIEQCKRNITTQSNI